MTGLAIAHLTTSLAAKSMEYIDYLTYIGIILATMLLNVLIEFTIISLNDTPELRNALRKFHLFTAFFNLLNAVHSAIIYTSSQIWNIPEQMIGTLFNLGFKFIDLGLIFGSFASGILSDNVSMWLASLIGFVDFAIGETFLDTFKFMILKFSYGVYHLLVYLVLGGT